MKSKTPATRLNLPATVKFIAGKKHIEMEIANTRLEDWVDKEVILTKLNLKDRNLRYMRSAKKIPFGKIGDAIRYYVPGNLFILEQSAAS